MTRHNGIRSAFAVVVDTLGVEVHPQTSLGLLTEEGDDRLVVIDEVAPGVVRIGLYPNGETDVALKYVETDDAETAIDLVRGWGFEGRSKVQTLLDALKADGWVNTEFTATGGGCHAICIPLGNTFENDYRQILITDNDAFSRHDLTSNDGLTGEWWIGLYDSDGDTDTMATIHDGERKFDAVVPEIVATVNRLAGVVV